MEINKENIVELAKRYPYITNDLLVEEEIKSWLKINKYLNKEVFVRLCCWKSPRPKKKYEKNDEQTVEEITKFSFSTNSERARVESLQILYGVLYPVASAILHFGFPDRYPIMDFRVIWSLKWEQPKSYNFEFWVKYCNEMRRLSEKFKLPIRVIDKALWTYSKENSK